MKTIEKKITEILTKHAKWAQGWGASEVLSTIEARNELTKLLEDESKAQLMELLGPDEAVFDIPKEAVSPHMKLVIRNQFREQLLKKISGDRKG